MEINQNSVYVVDDDITYLCIGFAEGNTNAILAPYWSDDEDCEPQIQQEDYLVVHNPYYGGRLKAIQSVRGRIELVE